MIYVFLLAFVLVTREFILFNEEFFVVLSFFFCFTYLYSVLAGALVEFQQKRIDEITLAFDSLLQKKIKALQSQRILLLNYKKFISFYSQIVSFVLANVEKKVKHIIARIPYVIDFHFRVLLNTLMLSYISYNEKISRLFVKVAHRYFFTRLSRPLYYVRQRGGFIFSHIDVSIYGFRAEDSRARVAKKHASRDFLPIPSHKRGVWAFLLKSYKTKIWFALFLRNPLLFF